LLFESSFFYLLTRKDKIPKRKAEKTYILIIHFLFENTLTIRNSKTKHKDAEILAVLADHHLY
jgi:hypothetical protein